MIFTGSTLIYVFPPAVELLSDDSVEPYSVVPRPQPFVLTVRHYI